MNNMSRNHIVDINGVKKTISEWADYYKIEYWRMQNLLEKNKLIWKRLIFFMGLIESLITGLFIITILAIYAIIVFIGLMFIQLISYRVFKFNIYKKILRKFMEV